MSLITFYSKAASKKAQNEAIDVELNSILKAIKSGRWKEIVEAYRNETDENKKKDIKAYKVPGVTVSGNFPNRRKVSELDTHSGFIAMDFDDIENLDRLELDIQADPYTYACFKSISGNGLCAIVKIEPKKHKDAFLGLERYYLKNYDVGVDPSCKDVTRLRFISYDPDLWMNANSKVFKDYIPKKKGRKQKIKPVFTSDDDVEYVVKQIEAKRLDLTYDYHVWVELAFALHSEYGEAGEEYFQRISQFHPDYDERKTRIKYKSARGGSGITINTFFHYAKQAGLEIVTPKTRTIQRASIYAKKGGRTTDDVVNQLKEVDGIDKKESRKVVEQIFNAEDTPELDDENIVAQLEDWLRRERSIVYNEVTLKYMEKGKPLIDRDFNSIYLDAKQIIPKVKKDLVLTCIDSDRTKTVNPLHNFFKKNSNRNPKGVIKELADTIESPTGLKDDKFNPEFIYHFLKKWLVGSVAMWHGKHSPLMFVLAGSKQNTGKTHWFRYLFPNELQPYYAEAELTGDKDENLLMCSNAIIMNDEMSNKSRRDITMMKKLCSVQWFNIRRPYGKASEDIRRLAALAGTSNSLEILSDPTGNRRIIPIEVISLDHKKYNNIDKTDLWMNAYHEFKSGYDYALSNDDIALLNENTNEFEETSPEAELIMKYFRKPDQHDSFCEFMTNTEIKSYCEVRTQQRLNSRKLGLELKALGYEQEIKRVNGRVKRAYALIPLES